MPARSYGTFRNSCNPYVKGAIGSPFYASYSVRTTYASLTLRPPHFLRPTLTLHLLIHHPYLGQISAAEPVATIYSVTFGMFDSSNLAEGVFKIHPRNYLTFFGPRQFQTSF